MERLLYTTALVLAISGAAFAGVAAAQDETDPAAQAPAAEEEMGATEETAPAAEEMDTTEDMAPADEDMTTGEDTAAAPPAEAVIEAQEPTQERADELIGMTVMGGDGQEIGSAEDLLIDDQKQVTGVVISVGGFLGVGSKSVAVNWDEVEVRENPDTGSSEMLVNMTREQLEAAPAFKTKEDQEAERAAEQMQDTAPVGDITQ